VAQEEEIFESEQSESFQTFVSLLPLFFGTLLQVMRFLSYLVKLRQLSREFLTGLLRQGNGPKKQSRSVLLKLFCLLTFSLGSLIEIVTKESVSLRPKNVCLSWLLFSFSYRFTPPILHQHCFLSDA
jgi:hypothetical protein